MWDSCPHMSHTGSAAPRFFCKSARAPRSNREANRAAGYRARLAGMVPLADQVPRCALVKIISATIFADGSRK